MTSSEIVFHQYAMAYDNIQVVNPNLPGFYSLFWFLSLTNSHNFSIVLKLGSHGGKDYTIDVAICERKQPEERIVTQWLGGYR